MAAALVPPLIHYGLQQVREAPAVQPLVFVRDYKAWLTDHQRVSTIANVILYLLYATVWGFTNTVMIERVIMYPDLVGSYAHGLDIGSMVTVTDNAVPPVLTETWISIGYTTDPTANPPNYADATIPVNHLQFMKDFSGRIHRLFLELVGAHQVRPIRENNINGLLANYRLDAATMNLGAQILPHMAYFSAASPNIIGHVSFQAVIPGILWLKYHTSAASSPSLIRKAYTDLGALGGIIFSVATMLSVNNSLASPWDMALVQLIPKAAIGVAAIYLKASNQYPANKWYQGEQALSSFPAWRRDQLDAFFKRYAVLASDVNGITNSNDLAQLSVVIQGLVGAGF